MPEALPTSPLMTWLTSFAGLDVQRPWMSRYGMALAAVAVATVVRLLLDPIMEDRAPYGLYILATAFIAWRSGWGPAVMTVCVGALLARYFFELPRGTLSLPEESNYIALCMSLLLGFTTALVCESLR